MESSPLNNTQQRPRPREQQCLGEISKKYLTTEEGGADAGPQYWRYGCGSYSLRDTQLKYK